MAKSVLEYVQACLSVMNSDEVDEINETTESIQVAELLKEVYYELLNREEWPWLHGPITLTAAGDTDNPTQFTIPATVKYIESLAYNVSESTGFVRKELLWLPPSEFALKFATGEGISTKQLVTLGTQVNFYVSDDRWPTWWTTFDDATIVCDAFHSDYQSTLTSNKVSAFGVSIPTFDVTDEFTPDVPLHIEPLLQAELNREAFQYFKQTESVPDERKAQRQLARARREAARANRDKDDRFSAKYGRRTYGRSSRAA